jgi:hypothetical protein
MARGGKRPGAGRPPGPLVRITDYWDKEAIDEYFEYLRDNYKESDKLMVFVGEHLMGKAPQALDITSGGKPLLINDFDEK